MAHRLADIEGTRDENGIATVLYSWWVEELNEIFSVGEPEIQFRGSRLPEKTRGFSLWENDTVEGGYKVTITYEGPDWAMGERLMHTYGFETDLSEQPVETHPHLDLLELDHGGYLVELANGEQRLVFERDFHDNPAHSGSAWTRDDAAAAVKAKGEKNPNFGYRSYPRYESVWMHTYPVKTLPRDLLQRVATTVATPPGEPPTPPGRDWMILSPEIEVFRADTGYRITDRYKLSPPDGWPPVLTMMTIV